LKNVFNWALPTAESAFGAGQKMLGGAMDTLGQAGGYYQKLLSGNRPAMLQAVAPETGAVRSASDAAARQQAASGTARGGGVAGANQQREDATMAKIDQLLFGVRPMAAEGATRVGATEAGVGGTELAAATNVLGMGTDAAANLGALATKSRSQSFDINRQTQQDVAGAIDAVMGMFV
jgi:hypothetical protein